MLNDAVQSFDPLPGEPNELNLDEKGHRETWADALRRHRGRVEPASFAAIEAPVLMLHGMDDPHPGRMISETLTVYMPQLQLIELDRCGHTPWIERQARKKFLHELRTWALSNA